MVPHLPQTGRRGTSIIAQFRLKRPRQCNRSSPTLRPGAQNLSTWAGIQHGLDDRNSKAPSETGCVVKSFFRKDVAFLGCSPTWTSLTPGSRLTSFWHGWNDSRPNRMFGRELTHDSTVSQAGGGHADGMLASHFRKSILPLSSAAILVHSLRW